MDYVVVIVSLFFSGLVGVIITTVNYSKQQKRRVKLETLKDFVGYRYALSTEHKPSQAVKDSFARAANEAFITFNDSKEVMCALQNFHDVIISGNMGLRDDALIRLTKAMCKELRIEIYSFTDQFFKKPFTILPFD